MLKIAISGCGLIATKNHIPTFQRLKNKVKIVALCDLNRDILEKVANKFNIKNVYTDFSQMLERENPDIIDICTPPKTHAELAVQALEKGSHVLLEKPIALELKDCDAIIEAAKRYKKKVCIMHNQIFNPAFTKAKDSLLKGEIGDFLGMRIFLSTPADYITSRKEHWAHKLPGGVLGETGPHAVYMALAFLKGVYDVNIYARKVLPQYTWSKSEDFRINLMAQNGIASVFLAYGSNQWAANVDIIGTKGILKIDLESRSVVKYNRPDLGAFSVGKSLVDIILQTSKTLFMNSIKHMLGKNYNAHTIGISRFIESILKNKPTPVTAEEGREAVRIMQMIVKKLLCQNAP